MHRDYKIDNSNFRGYGSVKIVNFLQFWIQVSVSETGKELDGTWPDSELPNEKYSSFSPAVFFPAVISSFYVNQVLLGVSIINTYYVPFSL